MSLWKVIAQKTAGTSHLKKDVPCEDAFAYDIVKDAEGHEVFFACVSDGAGSAKFGGLAAEYVTENAIQKLRQIFTTSHTIVEEDIYIIAEQLHDELSAISFENQTDLKDFSCTFLGFILFEDSGIFFQIGDGAIVRCTDGDTTLVPVYWPQNGEYQNTTNFLVQDKKLSNLWIRTTADKTSKVAVFTDGLQNLALANDTQSVHQPFFMNMLLHLETARTPESISLFNEKLLLFLQGEQVNARTDDDKTLILASRYQL